MDNAKVKIKDGVLLKYLSDEEVIVIPKGVTKIGSKVFSTLFKKCKNVKKVIIPDFITEIYNEAFSGCKLMAIEVDDKNKNYASVDGVLYNKTKTELIFYPHGRTDSKFTVPNGVTCLHFRAFFGSRIRKITLPISIEKIDYMSLYDVWDVSYEGNQGQWSMIETCWAFRNCTVYCNDGGRLYYSQN